MGQVCASDPKLITLSWLPEAQSGTITMRRLGGVPEQKPTGKCRFKQGETDMGDKGKRDKGKKEQQKKAQLGTKEKRKRKKEKKNK
jgi:hypothetical protein